jgi:HEPN domain-containing protein
VGRAVSVERKVESFLTLAREDLAAAKILRKTFPRHAAFHLSQAAEKAIKAVLTAEGFAFNAGHHQLGRLVTALPGEHPWRADLMALDKHTAAATATRYPMPGGAPPAAPGAAHLSADMAELEALLPEIADWCRER